MSSFPVHAGDPGGGELGVQGLHQLARGLRRRPPRLLRPAGEGTALLGTGNLSGQPERRYLLRLRVEPL